MADEKVRLYHDSNNEVVYIEETVVPSRKFVFELPHGTLRYSWSAFVFGSVAGSAFSWIFTDTIKYIIISGGMVGGLFGFGWLVLVLAAYYETVRPRVNKRPVYETVPTDTVQPLDTFVQTAPGRHQRLKLPKEPKRQALQHYLHAIYRDDKNLSVRKARKYAYTLEPFNQLRDELLRQELIEWVNEDYPQQGLQKTEQGELLIRKHLGLELDTSGITTPPPAEVEIQ